MAEIFKLVSVHPDLHRVGDALMVMRDLVACVADCAPSAGLVENQRHLLVAYSLLSEYTRRRAEGEDEHQAWQTTLDLNKAASETDALMAAAEKGSKPTEQ